MNIVVKTYSGACVVRPDTTWKKNIEDFYPTDDVSRLSYVPVLFTTITKAGRSISAKFANRYYSGFNYGILLYPEDFLDGSETGFARACCLNQTTYLPFPLYNNIVLGQDGNEFKLYKGNRCIYKTSGQTHSIIEQALEDATKHIWVRAGDIVAIELEPRKPLCKREDGDCAIKAKYCSNPTFDFKIIM